MIVNKHNLQRGFSLVEVFVGLLVLSVGLIALAKLQVDLIRGSSDARTRSIALSLAEEKIEDLRTFASVDPTALSWTTTRTPMNWNYIGGPVISATADTSCSTSCTGGRLAPQTTYSSALEVAGVRFKRTWEVTSRAYGAGATASTAKDVRVTISWLNELGVEQSVNLLSSIVNIPPGNVSVASQRTARPAGPQVSYTPGEAPEVIGVPIDTGTTKRETTKPIPSVKKTADSTTVTFDVVNYHDGTNKISRREEFVTLNCKCTFNGTGRGRTPAKVAFVGGVLRDEPGKVFTDKVVGVPADTLQPDLCGICCRDHHDYTAGGVDYRYKPTSGSAHTHFGFTRAGAVDLSSPVTTGDYAEACRLKRINGVFQVFEDWQLKTLTVLPKSDLLLSSPKQAEYIAAVKTFVKNYGNAIATGTSLPTALTYTPSAVTVGLDSQLVSRAIYIDNMPSALVTKVGSLLGDADPTNDDLALSLIPFYEIHLTKLATWMSRDVSKNKARVTSADIPSGSALDSGLLSGGLYSRGFVQAQPSATAGTTRIISTAKNYNTGVTGTPAINLTEDGVHPIDLTETVGTGASATPYYYTNTDPESAPAEHKDGSMEVTVGGATSLSGSFIDAAGTAKTDPSEINDIIAATDGAVCVGGGAGSSSTGRDKSVEAYSCTFPSATWTGSITFASSAGYTFCRDLACASPLPGGTWTITSLADAISSPNIYVYKPKK